MDNDRILLVKPPFFTPWTPPLSIAALKSHLRQYGYRATCLDLNTDSDLWGTHHRYFAALQQMGELSINDGYSKLWWILNAHMLAYANGANPTACSRILDSIIPLYGIKHDSSVVRALIPIVEGYFKRLEKLTDCLDLPSFEVVGTSTYTTSLASSLFILKRIKRMYPHITTVIGGGVFADDLAPGSHNLETLISEYPFVDYIVIGEGELLFLNLLQGELANQRVISLADIGGTTLDMEKSGIPDFSDLDSESYYHLTIEGGRSCPFQCKFCSETTQWGEYRKKPEGMLVEQVVELARQYGNNTFFLADSLMNPYITAFSRELLEREANILFDGYLRAERSAANRERVELWARSGLYRVRLGMESGSARMLGLMNKRTSPDVMSEALRTLANAGIRTTTYWIVGFPGEREEDFQETLRFVREHHRYIYELEAHPYYYYPQGQAGSRQLDCSLYPDHVTKVIKFKRWDVRNREPTREATYDRLRRLSRLAADLGLPNIYTMEERYQAEDRWHLLYPLVVEVYEGTQVCRKVPVSHSITPPDNDGQRRTKGYLDSSFPICYRVFVRKKLDEAILSAAVVQLIQHNEMLQMTLRGGRYIPVSEEGQRLSDGLVSVYSCQDKDRDGTRVLGRRAIEELAAQVRPERGASIRIALIDIDQQSSEIILLAHRAIVDGRSAVLLLEDLYRIYEQLSVGRKVALRPIRKTYVEFMGELAVTDTLKERSAQRRDLPLLGASEMGLSVYDSLAVDDCVAKSSAMLLDKSLSSNAFFDTVAECGLMPEAVLAGGLLRCLATLGKSGPIGIEVAISHRSIDPSLEYTVGPLTRAIQLPAGIVTDDRLSDPYEVQQILRNMSLDNVESGIPQSGEGKRALLNLEYFVGEPWLGGDVWMPQGFVMDGSRPANGYALEVVPVSSDGAIKVQLRYQDTPGLGELIGIVANRLIQEVEEVLKYCEQHRSAKRFWLQEFEGNASRSLIEEIKDDEDRSLHKGWASVRESVPNPLRTGLEADWPDIILAAYCVLLSRLSGRQDTTIVHMGGEHPFPIRIRPLWSMNFTRLVQDIQNKIAQAMEHRAHAFHVLTNPLWTQHFFLPAFEIGYAFRDSEQRREEGELEETLRLYPTIRGEMSLILEVARNRDNLDIRFLYRRSQLGQEAIGELVSHLTSVLGRVSENPNLFLGYIAL